MSLARRTLWAAATAALLVVACSKREEPAPPKPALPVAEAFTILAGSELKDLEAAIVATGKGAGVEVKLSYAGTLDIVERINAGERFDAILPPNGAYPALALTTKPLARDKLFYSRIALGVKAAKLTELGWDKKPPGWNEIAQAAGSGKLRFAMTNATSSNTGMSALFAVASASAGKSEDLAAADVNEGVIKAFLAGQRLTAGSSGWLAESYAKSPDSVDAMINYEAVILRVNERLPADQRLTPVYPRDGMISADYPLMLLNADKRNDYAKLVAALKAKPFQHDALGPAFLRPANPEVAPVAALPLGTVAELSFPNRLEVIDAVLAAYQAQWRRPSTSIFVLDISGSMKGDRIQSMREALKVLAGADPNSAAARYAAFQARERVVLLAFDDRVEPPVWVRFEGKDLEASRAALRARADALSPRGGTAIFDALDVAEKLAQEERQREPDRFVSIVLLTDGENNAGMSFDEFRGRYAATAPASVFPILFGEGNVAQMQELASVTGGREFDGRSARLTQVFREIRGYQ